MGKFLVSIFVFLNCLVAQAEEYPEYYEIGSIRVKDLFVNPKKGSDANSGDSQNEALKSLTAAWDKIEIGKTLSKGYRINILPGTIPESDIPNYMESRYGTAQAPIIIQSTKGKASVILQGDLNVFDVKYLFVEGVTIRPSPEGDTFHCEKCDHLLLRNSEFDGGSRSAHETIKINQSSNIYIEGNDIHGADDNAIDFVSVQYGHVLGNKIHDAEDWCQYAKGGSAYLNIEANEYYNCGTGGFTAGQGTGFEFMSAPWIHYEAYDLKFVNNIIHDIEGAGFGVNGGYNILFAYNSLYKVGSRSHLIEAVYGSRSCDGDTDACQSRLDQGGWGVAETDLSTAIPNKNVFVVNNLISNPTGTSSGSQHFAVYGPITTATNSNQAELVRADENLVIAGNYIWNGPSDFPLGVEETDQGCQPDNSTCNVEQLRSFNNINASEPQLLDVANSDFRPIYQGNVTRYAPVFINAFNGGDQPATPSAPVGDLFNGVSFDRAGSLRTSRDLVGAYILGSSVEVAPPPSSKPGAVPVVKAKVTIANPSVTKMTKKSLVIFTIGVKGGSPFNVKGTFEDLKKHSAKAVSVKKVQSGVYTYKVTLAKGSYRLTVSLKDGAGKTAKAIKKFAVS